MSEISPTFGVNRHGRPAMFDKDAKLLWPLAKAIWVGIGGLQLIAILIATLMSQQEAIKLHLAIWMLLPNLLALGAPAMLVGSEEENGTLAWLRTLPVSWRQIVDSKFFVSLVCLLVTWLISTIIVLILLWKPVMRTYGFIDVGLPVRSGSISMLWPSAIAHVVFLSFVLLSVGFAMAYLFRSPILALVVLVPVVAFVYEVTGLASSLLVSGRLYGDNHLTSPSEKALLTVAAIFCIALLWWIQRWLGARRMTVAPKNRSRKRKVSLSTFAYQPVRGGSLARPSVTTALLWQQARQVGIPTIVLTSLAFLFLVLMGQIGNSRERNWVWAFGPAVTVMSATVLGAICFYSDSVRRRCDFFADRGVSPTRIWWTRLIFPFAACLVIAIVTAIVTKITPQFPMLQWSAVLIVFAVGQLVSMWVKRPVLSFFVTPVFAFAVLIPYSWLYGQYPQYAWVTVLFVPVLLFGTWRLVRPWIENRIDNRFHAKAIGLSALAVVFPFFLFAGHRIWTTPSEQTQWRKSAFAATDGVPEFDRLPISVGQAWNDMPMTGMDSQQVVKYHENVLAELKFLNTPGVQFQLGRFVRIEDVRSVLHDRCAFVSDAKLRGEMHADTVRLLLSWAVRLRKAAINRQIEIDVLTVALLVDQIEADVIERLTNPRAYIPSEELPELVQMIPSEKLRSDSRRAALLDEWRKYQDSKQGPHSGRVKFLRIWMNQRRGLLFFEQTRLDRNIDQMVQKLCSDLENGLPNTQSAIEILQKDLPASHAPVHHRERPFRTWTSAFEDRITKLRKRFPIE